jgi:hypothetical protein
MHDDVEERLGKLTIRGTPPELRERVLAAVAGELQAAPKEHCSPSPGQRPGERNGSRSFAGPTGQPFGKLLARWADNVGSGDGSPGRCPGLGEQEGLRPIEPLVRDIVTATTDTIVCTAKPPTDSPWLRRAATAVAASLLLGIGLNIWAAKASEQRLARLFGPPPISKQAMEIAKDVEKITDAQTGQWVYRQLAMPRKPGDAAVAYSKYRDTVKRLIDELQTVSKDSCHETLQKDTEMDRGHTGCVGGRRFDCQRRVRLDYRCTA